MPAEAAPPQDFRESFAVLSDAWKAVHLARKILTEAGIALGALPHDLPGIPSGDLFAVVKLASDSSSLAMRAIERARTAAAIKGE